MEVASITNLVPLAEIFLPAAVALTTTTALSAAVWWYHYPDLFIQYVQHLGIYLAGMRLHYVKVQGLNICYAEKGQKRMGSGPSMLFVHGFSVSKEMWLPTIPLLPNDQHVIMLDLPGHGASDIPGPDMELHIHNMAEFLQEFVETIGMDKEPFHIIGLSMGGAIAGLYAAMYPKHVALLTSCCPAILTPKESKFLQEIRAGKSSALLPTSIEGARKMFSMCVHHSSRAPSSSLILMVFMAARKKRQDFYVKLFNTITECMDEKSNELMQHVREIQAESQVIWGEQDEILDVSGAEHLQKCVLKCKRVDILESCGHVITFDRPAKLVNLLLDFRGELHKRKRYLIL